MCVALQVPIATFNTAERAAQFLAYMKEEKLPIPTKEEKKQAKRQAQGALLLQPQPVCVCARMCSQAQVCASNQADTFSVPVCCRCTV